MCAVELWQHIEAKLPMLEPGIAMRKVYEKIPPMIAAAVAKDYPDLDLGISMEEEPAEEEADEDVDEEKDDPDGDDNVGEDDGDDEMPEDEDQEDEDDEDEDDEDEEEKAEDPDDLNGDNAGDVDADERDEDDDEEKSYYPSKASLPKRYKTMIVDAAEHLEECGCHSDMPKLFRAGHKHHSRQLGEVMRALNGSRDDDSEADKSYVAESIEVEDDFEDDDLTALANELAEMREDLKNATGRID